MQWYQNQTIEQVLWETDSTYIVQIGIMAQAFRLKRANDDFEEQLTRLQEGMVHQRKFDIAIEKGTATIVSVKESRDVLH
ncbi:hypothetical protein [Sphingobacterium suaedae]|uniref:Uncharacterized protein n=1 Tax=Sphingobacterium suaedae TaxID=1686402 RepID=A0ABW5KG27_9SPHI